MRPEELRRLLQQRPFRPFRLHVSDGATYDVAHPECVGVVRSMAYIILPAGGTFGTARERVAYVSLIHIARVEVFFPSGVSPSA